jgi:putative phosphoribosyl transferase
MFRNREDAAHQLAQRLKGRQFYDPLVLAIPRGGVVTGAMLARELRAELDVVLSRKLRAPVRSDPAIGAVSEGGHVYLNPQGKAVSGLAEEYLAEEIGRQRAVLARQEKLIRGVRPAASVADRSVVVADDGILTGATMIAALQFIETKNPLEVIVAVPVASAHRLREVRRWCNDVVWLVTPDIFRAIDEFYEGFPPVKTRQVVDLLGDFAPVS